MGILAPIAPIVNPPLPLPTNKFSNPYYKDRILFFMIMIYN